MTENTRPTLQTLIDRIKADIDARLPGAISRPVKSVINVLAIVVAGAFHSVYGFAEWIQQQIDPLTASETWLFIWGSRLNVPRKPATLATGYFNFASSDDQPITIAEGTRVQASDGSIYQTLEEGETGNNIPSASLDAGQLTNIQANDYLVLVTPIERVELSPTHFGFQDGSDEESLESWANRIAEKLSDRQKIGDEDDYKRWAKAAHTSIVDAHVESNTPAHGYISITVLGNEDQPVIPDEVLQQAKSSLDRLRNMAGIVQLSAVVASIVDIELADVPEEYRAFILADLNTFIKTKQVFKAKLWPQEIERIVAGYVNDYTLLSPVSKVEASERSIIQLGEVSWA